MVDSDPALPAGAPPRGEMSEWLKEHAWKACVGVILLPWVRIPLSPPLLASARSDGESGIQALRGSRRFGLESPGIASPSGSPGIAFRSDGHAERGNAGASRLAPLRARIPWNRLPLRRARREGERRRSAARAASGSNPLESPRLPAPLESLSAPTGAPRGGTQALRGSRRFGLESPGIASLSGSPGIAFRCDGRAERGNAGASRLAPQSVRSVIRGRCAGWARPPTPEEVYDTMRATERNARQRSAIGVLTQEADFKELVNAHHEGAFTWRQLVRAFQERQYVPRSRAGFLKRLARG